MPIANNTDEEVSVLVKPPTGGAVPIPTSFAAGAATGVGFALLACGLSGGHPTTAVVGAVVAAAAAAWTVARRRRPSPRGSRRLASTTQAEWSGGTLPADHYVDEPTGFTTDSEVVFSIDANTIASVTFANGSGSLYKGTVGYNDPNDPNRDPDDFDLTELDDVLVSLVEPEPGKYQVVLACCQA